MSTVVRCCLPLFLCLLAPVVALADFTVGGDARAVAMGGAGIATGEFQGSTSLNPAALAATGGRIDIEMPSVSASLDGASLDTSNALSLVGNPLLSAASAYNMAVQLGREPSQVDAAASMGLLLPKLDLRADAVLRANIAPNAAFQQWAQSGYAMLPDDARTDITAIGVATLPNVGLGFYVPGTGTLSLGVRVKPTQAYYSHFIVDKEALANGTPGLAPEMEGRDYVRANSLSADAGLLYVPESAPYLRLGVVVNNLIEPRAIDFGVPTPEGLYSQQIAPRSVSAGAALVGDALTLAADLVDVTRKAVLRTGGELRITPLLALRAGYHGGYGFTYGLGFGNYNIAFSREMPVSLSSNITF